MKRFLLWLVKPSTPSHISICFLLAVSFLLFAFAFIKPLPDIAEILCIAALIHTCLLFYCVKYEVESKNRWRKLHRISREELEK